MTPQPTTAHCSCSLQEIQKNREKENVKDCVQFLKNKYKYERESIYIAANARV